MHRHPNSYKKLSGSKMFIPYIILAVALGIFLYFLFAGRADLGENDAAVRGSVPQTFNGPAGPPHVNGPTGPPPQY